MELASRSPVEDSNFKARSPSPGGAGAAVPIAPGLFLFRDTCNVYVIRNGDSAVLIDFGDGDVLDHLPELGITGVTDVLMTHHHRDQGQGLARAVQVGARIWVPHSEQDLFREVDQHWQARTITNNYNSRQDRYSLLEPVPVAGALKDYAIYPFGEQLFTVVPTPGHTPGSISLFTEISGQKFAFTGDLIASPGKIWSLAATQWTYNGGEGAAYNILSLLDLKQRAPDLLLPSHGAPMRSPGSAIDLLVERLHNLLDHRRQNLRLFELLERPYQVITPHLLFNRTSLANSYVLLSERGKALLIDFGYDFMAGGAAGDDRASRRPWLYTLNTLKRAFGVRSIDVVIPTHYHDDHVAGVNLLREIEGTQVWAAANFAEVLEQPTAYDLPCLWYDPIPVDRILPLGEPFPWEEFELQLYPLPGHTRFAVAIAFEVDGKRALATGDQYQDEEGYYLNYVYQNRYRLGDYQASVALLRQLSPDLILSGHLPPRRVEPGYFDLLDSQGQQVENIQRSLLADEIAGFDAEGFGARIQPYQSWIKSGEWLKLDVEVRNPSPGEQTAMVRLVAPEGWQVSSKFVEMMLPPFGERRVSFEVCPPAGYKARRARVAVDMTVGERRLGQQAEALVNIG